MECRNLRIDRFCPTTIYCSEREKRRSKGRENDVQNVLEELFGGRGDAAVGDVCAVECPVVKLRFGAIVKRFVQSVGSIARLETFRIVPPVTTLTPKDVFSERGDEVEQRPADDHIVIQHAKNTVDDHGETNA